MSALGRVVRAGVARRRVQTLVMTLTTMMAVAASVLSAGLIVASSAPFDDAFSRQRGAHLTAWFDGRDVPPARLAATARVSGVSASTGPYRVLSLAPRIASGGPGVTAPPITVAGRDAPGGPIDAVGLVEGRWATAPGEIVLSPDALPVRVGDRLSFPDARGGPTLTVVGRARSAGRSADAWTSPAQLRTLGAAGAAPAYQMLYRFADASTGARLAAHRAAIAAAVPPGSLTGAESYLTIKLAAERESGVYVPFVVAFGVLGLFMSVLTIGVVVNGAVGAATRRIGVLKSLGFTPAQVVRAYVVQALAPALAGAALGVALGNLLAIPAMRRQGDAFGTGAQTIPLWIDLAVPAAALVAVAVTALVPASRAGRLRAAEAIVDGRAPRPGRGRGIQRMVGRPVLPCPISMGLAAPFARPARSAAMGATVAFGMVAVTFTTGLVLSFGDVQDGLNRRSPGAVVVHTVTPPSQGSSGAPRVADAAAVARTIDAQPGTRRHFRTSGTEVRVAGLADAVDLVAYEGDSAWGSYQMITGSWFRAPGEAVAPSGFLEATGTRTGDTITLANGDRQVRIRLVGETFDLRDGGMVILTDAASVAGLGARFDPPSVRFHIDLMPGTGPGPYLTELNRALTPLGAGGRPNTAETSSTVTAMNALAGSLTVLLVAVAALGVLNTVVLDTRERVHDLGVLKALGMSPRQTVAMVVTTAAAIGLVAGAIGVPVGMMLHEAVMPLVGDAAGTRIPEAYMAVYQGPVLAVLLVGGAALATAGALLPATWAARVRTATALRTE
ncbi:ABC transporter permease [Actinomadura rubrisoli]|uniref:ABC transporter permease n=1 Tax=Actinomadura rubrisoli TaxID=2530368 RepID=A0A4V2YWQ9_9ACTN|nr:ABC transporter permease [Actinomadura rubrisoli]TDD86377.1 ABC transporter permease [Actinomadura rubrisoli]